MVDAQEQSKGEQTKTASLEASCSAGKGESPADRSTSRETVATVFAHRHDVSRIRSVACNRL